MNFPAAVRSRKKIVTQFERKWLLYGSVSKLYEAMSYLRQSQRAACWQN
jgi:hypothetical protein